MSCPSNAHHFAWWPSWKCHLAAIFCLSKKHENTASVYLGQNQGQRLTFHKLFVNTGGKTEGDMTVNNVFFYLNVMCFTDTFSGNVFFQCVTLNKSCLYQPTSFLGSDERRHRAVSSSRSTRSAYQKQPTASRIPRPGSKPASRLLTHLKSENSLRSFRPQGLYSHSLNR